MQKILRYWKTALGYVLVVCLCLGLTTFGSRTVSVMIENSPMEDRTLIAIDAGHGGIDGGAQSCTGVAESQINLEIALRLNDLLTFLGYETFLLRTEDTSLHTDGTTIAAQKVSDLKNRVRIVADTKPDLLISIHQNTFTDERYSGAQVFYANTEESSQLARMLQQNLVQIANPGSNRKPKQAKGIYLMERIVCSGVLVECGFLTNYQEEAKLRTAEYQKEICGVLAATISSWGQKKEAATTP